MHICGGGDEGRSTGHLTIDGSQTRLTYARESARNGPPPARVRDAKGDGNSGFEHAQEGAAHRGLKKTAFGVPEGFYPDQASRVYFLPPTPTLAPTLTLTPTPTLTLTLTPTLTVTLTPTPTLTPTLTPIPTPSPSPTLTLSLSLTPGLTGAARRGAAQRCCPGGPPAHLGRVRG